MSTPFLTTLPTPDMLSEQPPSSEEYTELLRDYVTPDGHVNYAGMQKDERLPLYCATLSASHPERFDKWQDVLTFWINVYNAFTLKLICENYDKGLKSINELHLFGSLAIATISKQTIWQTYKFNIGNSTYSLDQVENEILRQKFKDPRIHAAINCASGSCPRLLNKAYKASSIEQDLEDSMRRFVADSQWDFDNKSVVLNKIFKWFEKDFTAWLAENDEGSIHNLIKPLDKSHREEYENDETKAFKINTVQPPLIQYLWLYSKLPVKLGIIRGEKKKPEQKKWNIKYADYDWSLNSTKEGEVVAPVETSTASSASSSSPPGVNEAK